MKQGATGIYARLAGSAALLELLEPGNAAAAGERLVPTWPDEVLAEPAPAHFPLVTWILPVWAYLASGVAVTDVDVDVWTWPDGPRGDGVALMDQMETHLVELLDGKVWHHGGARLHCNVEPVRNDPATARDEPHRRTLKLNLLVSLED